VLFALHLAIIWGIPQRASGRWRGGFADRPPVKISRGGASI